MYHNTAIVFGDLKEALLHFEYVIPANLTGEFMGLRPAGPTVEKHKEPGMTDYYEVRDYFGDTEAVAKLYPPHLAQADGFKELLNVFEGLLFAFMVKKTYGEEKYQIYLKPLAEVVTGNSVRTGPPFSPTAEGLQNFFTKLTQDFELQDIPIDGSNFVIAYEKSDAPENTLLTQKIRMIDTDKVRIADLMEFRKDKETMSKMRNFRLFAYEQYLGKDRAYIEDDILKRLHDYEEVVRSCGFETTEKILSFLFDSKLLLGSFAASAVALLMGNPQLAREAFSAGAIIQVGKLSLEYAKQRHALQKICRENPISYVADVKRLFDSK
jgi:hypothetical protein